MSGNVQVFVLIKIDEVSGNSFREVEWKLWENQWFQEAVKLENTPAILSEYVRSKLTNVSVAILRIVIPNSEMAKLKKILSQYLGSQWIAF